MKSVSSKVVLLSMTDNPESLIYSSFRQCYKKGFVGDDWEKELNSNSSLHKNFIKNVLESGHVSPLEHVSFTFAIEGISRSLSHQLVRHRIASYSQQSQRYVSSKDNFNYILPLSIKKMTVIKEKFNSLMEEIKKFYDDCKELTDIPNEDIRYILPNAMETKIVVTMNCRSLINFFNLRCCNRAQWEIRDMANKMLSICKEKLPVIFDEAGAPCKSLKYCPETSKFSCGKFPTKKEFFEKRDDLASL